MSTQNNAQASTCMRAALLICAAAIALSACGVQRPLLRPSEEEQRKKREERENYRRDNNI